MLKQQIDRYHNNNIINNNINNDIINNNIINIIDSKSHCNSNIRRPKTSTSTDMGLDSHQNPIVHCLPSYRNRHAISSIVMQIRANLLHDFLAKFTESHQKDAPQPGAMKANSYVKFYRKLLAVINSAMTKYVVVSVDCYWEETAITATQTRMIKPQKSYYNMLNSVSRLEQSVHDLSVMSFRLQSDVFNATNNQ